MGVLTGLLLPLTYVTLLRNAFRGCWAPGRSSVLDDLGRVGARYGSALWIGVATVIQLVGVGIGAAIVAAIAGDSVNEFLVALVILAVFLWVVLGVSLSFAVLVVEDERGFTACGRSWRLIRSHTWRSMGALALSVAMTVLLQLTLTLIPTSALGFRGGHAVLRTLFSGTVESLVTTFTAAVLAVLYLDLRGGARRPLDPVALRAALDGGRPAPG